MNQETQMHEEEKKILDSGNRRQFYDKDGKPLGVRDADDSKGRCDLMVLDCISKYFKVEEPCNEKSLTCSHILEMIDMVLWNKIPEKMTQEECILAAIKAFIAKAFDSKVGEALMALSRHYSEGAKKYGEHNFRKGIPCHCYVDSTIRHLLKWYDEWNDEPHDRAVLWNLFGLLWTLNNKPELNDLPYNQEATE